MSRVVSITRSVGKVVEVSLDKKHNYISTNGIVSHNCKHCTEFWTLSDGSPRVYKLSELIANGSNYGKKSADHKPTIDTTHPHCRCLLVEIPKGFGFKDGGLTYVGKAHDEHKHQKAK